jgi:glycosyltransferase involved in cell wall biosynthesis
MSTLTILAEPFQLEAKKKLCQSLSVTVVIATLNRTNDLQETLEDWRAGAILPTEVRIVDASDDTSTKQLCQQIWSPLRVTYIHSSIKSAARQRNLGAADCVTDLILFCDDDVRLPKDSLEKLLTVFEQDTEELIGGIAGIIINYHHSSPGRLLRWYYRLQAGYDHETFGGHYFGPSINLLPTDRLEDPELYPSQWLNAGLVVYRTELFHRERFPEFSGYSFQEDVNVSSRIGCGHKLFFHRGVRYIHKGSSGNHKSNVRQLAAMQLINRWSNATKLLKLDGRERLLKFTLSQLFNSLLLLRSRQAGWQGSLAGSWLAWWRLAILGQDVDKVLREMTR